MTDPTPTGATETESSLDERYRSWRWKIFGSTWLCYAGYYLTRKAFAVAKIGMQDDPDLAFSNIQLGYIDLAYLIAYTVGQFVTGPLADRLGPRRVVLIGMAGSVLACLFSGLATGLGVFVVFAIIQGMNQSTGWPSLVKNVRSWFSLRERGTVMGWWCTNYAIGGLLAGPFCAYAIVIFSNNWRAGFFAPSAALVLIAIVFFIFQRDRPRDVGLPSIEEYHHEPILDSDGDRAASHPTILGAIRELAANRVILILGIAYFCLKPTRYAILFWGPKFINEQLGTDVTGSALISAAFELGGPIGVIFAGYASDRFFGSRRLPICALLLPLAGVTLLLLDEMASLGVAGVVLVLFVLGFALYGPDSIISGTAAMDFSKRHSAGSAAGFINGMGSLGAIFGGGLPGYISDKFGQPVLFYSLAGLMFVAAALMIPLWKLKPHGPEEETGADDTKG